MSLDTSVALAAQSLVYTWEPPDRVIAARYGLDPSTILRFDLNTSPRPPAFLDEILAGPFEPALNEYPDSTYAAFAEAAADYVGARPEEILVGAGADEVLDVIAKTFLPPGGTALLPIPTYAMYGVLTSQRGATLASVPRRPAEEGFALDVDAIEARLADAAVLWIAAPNNPTATPESSATIERLLDAGAALPGGGPIVVADEAYTEFHPDSVVGLRHRYPALVVVRTLSKAFALPGARTGYAVAARPTIERLERLRPAGSISTISAAIAAAALRRPDAVRANVEAIVAERGRLAAALTDAGITPYPSVTNFLLCRIGSVEEAEDATEHLLRLGIVCRTFSAANPLRGHLRFTVRTTDENAKLVTAVAAWVDGKRS
jgi:histidinol-phosphate aminotransferase